MLKFPILPSLFYPDLLAFTVDKRLIKQRFLEKIYSCYLKLKSHLGF